MYLLLSFISLLGLGLAAVRNQAPAGALVVGARGQYKTIQAAVNAINPSSTASHTIFIESGTYNEQVIIPALSGKLTVLGQTSDTTSYHSNSVTIRHSLALQQTSDDEHTATLRTRAVGSAFYNLNIVNGYGPGGQALAVSAFATEQGFYGCGFYGWQDTLMAETGNQIYARCYIEGAIDFIFGQYARAWFDSCDIRVKAANAAITANGRDSASNPSYYVINRASVAAASGSSAVANETYLGRPWGDYARVVYQYCDLSDIINSAGWRVWQPKDTRTKDVFFGEYDNSGVGSEGQRAHFVQKLGGPQSISGILGGNYANWVDTSYL